MTLDNLQSALKYTFQNPTLLLTAMTHRSFINENRGAHEHNERLEFLGDAVLELITTEYLYMKYPGKPEGDMTTWRSALVRGDRLAAVARELQLGIYLRLSRGEERSGGRDKGYLLANAFEAIIGAMYLDGGITAAEALLAERLLPRLSDILAEGSHIDAKSRLQEQSQERQGITPTYVLVAQTGPDHEKIFTMAARLGKEEMGRGNGSSKQLAEQAAAGDALKNLGW